MFLHDNYSTNFLQCKVFIDFVQFCAKMARTFCMVQNIFDVKKLTFFTPPYSHKAGNMPGSPLYCVRIQPDVTLRFFDPQIRSGFLRCRCCSAYGCLPCRILPAAEEQQFFCVYQTTRSPLHFQFFSSIPQIQNNGKRKSPKCRISIGNLFFIRSSVDTLFNYYKACYNENQNTAFVLLKKSFQFMLGEERTNYEVLLYLAFYRCSGLFPVSAFQRHHAAGRYGAGFLHGSIRTSFLSCCTIHLPTGGDIRFPQWMP